MIFILIQNRYGSMNTTYHSSMAALGNRVSALTVRVGFTKKLGQDHPEGSCYQNIRQLNRAVYLMFILLSKYRIPDC
jgi:UDP-N-acetylmuramyl tripeptide synthase